MNNPHRWKCELLTTSISRHDRIGPTAHGGLLVTLTSAGVLGIAGIAHGGPCTAAIAQLEQQISVVTPGPESGPTGDQTVGAQLHHQPTPGSVKRAERVANKDADAALNRAKKADTASDAAGCDAALIEARRLYDIDN